MYTTYLEMYKKRGPEPQNKQSQDQSRADGGRLGHAASHTTPDHTAPSGPLTDPYRSRSVDHHHTEVEVGATDRRRVVGSTPVGSTPVGSTDGMAAGVFVHDH